MRTNSPDTKTADQEERLVSVLIAYLRSVGLEQTKIAAQIRWKRGPLSQSSISRMLKRAEDEGLLARAPAFLGSAEELRVAKAKYLLHSESGEALRKILSPSTFLEISVFDGTSSEFVELAASKVLSLLGQSRRLGLMWGRTVAAIVNGIADMGIVHQGRSSPMCIPLCGDPVHLMNLWEVDYSASNLAAKLEKALSGSSKEERPCLSGVPAYVAAEILESSAFREFLNSIPGYDAIFRRKPPLEPPLIDTVDTIISSVGIVAAETAKAHETAAFIRERACQEKLSPHEFRRLLLGDLGGLLIARPGLNARDRKRVEELNKGWIGMRFEHLRRVARDAHSDSPPGVIAIASGASKAAVIAEIVRCGFVNQLIIDQTLCDELKSICTRRPAR